MGNCYPCPRDSNQDSSPVASQAAVRGIQIHEQDDRDRTKRKKTAEKKKQSQTHNHRGPQNPFGFDENPRFVLRDLIPSDSRTRTKVTDKYVLGRELGRGEFGVTHLCTDKETGLQLACKSIAKKRLRTAIDIEDVRREVSIMSTLPDHPNIIRLRAAYEDENAVHLVMELCEGGELFDRIAARGHYTERAAASIARTVAEVVRICHAFGVMHRDLKLENFLFATKKEKSPLKVIDFGLSVFFKPGERFTEIVGSPCYMAPEVLRRNYGPEVDIWSAGVIVYILICGVTPFWAETEQGVAHAILHGSVDFKREPWPQVSRSAKNLVKRMLERDPTKRLTAKQVLDHPWLRKTSRARDVPLGDLVRSRMKQFSSMNKFKKKAMRVIGELLSAEDLQIMSNVFRLMDTDNNGKVTFEELKVGLQKVGSRLAETEMRVMMEAADVNGNGALGYGEFVAVILHLRRIVNDEYLRRAFMIFDKNGSGYIEINELDEAITDGGGHVDVEVLHDILREMDTDKDGRISLEEFMATMKTGADWRKASRQFSRERFKSLSFELMQNGSPAFDP